MGVFARLWGCKIGLLDGYGPHDQRLRSDAEHRVEAFHVFLRQHEFVLGNRGKCNRFVYPGWKQPDGASQAANKRTLVRADPVCVATGVVRPTGIEPVSRVSETLILSVELRAPGADYSRMAAAGLGAHRLALIPL